MPRVVPPSALAPRFGELARDRIAAGDEESLKVEVMTPMFGGGAAPRTIDTTTPVSAKAVRGQLRFWWRLLCAPAIENPGGLDPTDLMDARESELFGSSELGSAFDVLVTDVGNAVPVPRRAYPGYVLFPLEIDDFLFREGLQFQLSLRWLSATRFEERLASIRKRRQDTNNDRARNGKSALPDPIESIDALKEQLHVALWGWFNLGGIGGRTRRGLGVVQPKSKGAGKFSLTDHRNLRHSSPHIQIYRGSTLGGDDKDAAINCWHTAVSLYREFRLNNRAQWPEPASIRRLIQAARGAGDATSAFPRAILGLPIVFHMKDVTEVLDRSNLDGTGARMASPVIVRPLRIDTCWCPAFIIIRTPQLDSVEAVLEEHPVLHDQIVSPTFGAFPNMRGKASALDALIDFAVSKGFVLLTNKT